MAAAEQSSAVLGANGQKQDDGGVQEKLAHKTMLQASRTDMCNYNTHILHLHTHTRDLLLQLSCVDNNRKTFQSSSNPSAGTCRITDPHKVSF